MSSAELEQHLNEASSELLDLVRLPDEDVEKPNTELDRQQHILDVLWVIKAAFQEVNALASIDADSALSTLKTLERKSEEFEKEYKGTLLAEDIRKQVFTLKGDLSGQLASQWHSTVSLVDESESATLRISSSAPVESVGLHLPRELDSSLQLIAKVVERLGSLEALKVISDNSNDEIKILYGPSDLTVSLQAVSSFVVGLGKTPLKLRAARRLGQQLCATLIRSLRFSLPASRDELASFPVKDIESLESILLEQGWARGDELSNFTAGIESEWKLVRQNAWLCDLRDILKGSYSPEKHGWPGQEAAQTPGERDEWDWDEDDEDQHDDWDLQSTKGPNPMDISKSESPFVIYEEAKRELGHLSGFTTLFRALAPEFYGKNKLALYKDAKRLIELGESELAPFAQRVLDTSIVGYENELLRLIDGIELRDEQSIAPEKTARICEWFAQVGETLDSDLRPAVISQLGELLVTTVISQIESLHDIATPHSAALVRAINGLKGIAPSFQGDVESEVPSWLKLLGLQNVLDGNLRDIHGLWEAGELLDFEPTELHALLRALFVDSDRLSAVLAEIH